MILFLDTADVLGITVIFAGELKSMANEYYWKVWLRPNLLTKDDDNDYVAEVLTQKDTLHN